MLKIYVFRNLNVDLLKQESRVFGILNDIRRKEENIENIDEDRRAKFLLETDRLSNS